MRNNKFLKILDSMTIEKTAIDPRRDFTISIAFPPINGTDTTEIEKALNALPVKYDIDDLTQTVDIPGFSVNSHESANNVIADIETYTTQLNAGSHRLKLSIINTVDPIFERVFYPWLREVTSPIWCYPDFPYTKATITISFNNHSTVEYMFFGCRPTSITALNATHMANTNLTRDVDFTYDLAAVSLKDEIIKEEQEQEQSGILF